MLGFAEHLICVLRNAGTHRPLPLLQDRLFDGRVLRLLGQFYTHWIQSQLDRVDLELYLPVRWVARSKGDLIRPLLRIRASVESEVCGGGLEVLCLAVRPQVEQVEI